MSFIATMHEMTLADIERRAAEEALAPMDEAQFRAFYERTAKPVWLYLRRITDDPQLADDLAQETYYRFYRAGASHESETHRRNSLFRIATNLANDSWRRRKKRGEHVPLDGNVDCNALAADDRTANLAEGRTDLQRAMSQLTESQREMLWLAYALGASHAEIGETIGVKTGSVKLMLFRARRKLAALLGGSRAKGGRRGED
jgi:RNA polymerase sigma-70 factor (ECF subfamily)